MHIVYTFSNKLESINSPLIMNLKLWVAETTMAQPPLGTKCKNKTILSMLLRRLKILEAQMYTWGLDGLKNCEWSTAERGRKRRIGFGLRAFLCTASIMSFR